jgi:biofilm PGA synthesis N-glycosyltransferase PgaC
MQTEIIIAFFYWAVIYLLIHSYLTYPFTLILISLFKKKLTLSTSESLPTVSILISAYNEEKVIAQRVENIKNLNYDFSKLELLIGSDCSTDKTVEILNDLSKEFNWLKVRIFSSRRGKASVLNDLVSEAKNDILVFTDANTKFDTNALSKIAEEFRNNKIGGVCGRLILDEPSDGFNQINREKLYWKYETFLKKYEGMLGVLIGANGGIFAIKRNLFRNFPEDQATTDDLYQTLAVLSQDFNFSYSYDAVGYEQISKELKTEFKRKIRFAATNFQTLKFFMGLLFSKNILLSYAFWSHKILRWLIPVMLIFLFIANILLLNYGQIYFIFFIIQLIFYSLSILGVLFSMIKINIPVVGVVYYYVVTNIALLIGLIKFLFKKHSYIWESTPR